MRWRFEAMSKSAWHRRCGLLVVENPSLTPTALVRVRLGKLPPLRAEIRWKDSLAADAARLGLYYLE